MILKIIRWYLYRAGYWYEISKNNKVWIGGNSNAGIGNYKRVGIGTPVHLLPKKLDVGPKKK